MEKERYGVHITHCCILHGCKYGYEDCPVELGEVKQEYTCQDCGDDNFNKVEEVEEFIAIQKQVEEYKKQGKKEIIVSTDFLERLFKR